MLLASWTPRNIVVTPGRAFGISGLIQLVLVCPLFDVVEPGVGELILQSAFSFFVYVLNEGAQLGAAPTTGSYGVGSAKGELLAALALEGDAGRMPLVGLAEGDFAGLVVLLAAFDDLLLHHVLLPLFSAVSSAGRSCPAAGSRSGGEPRSGRGRQVAIPPT